MVVVFCLEGGIGDGKVQIVGLRGAMAVLEDNSVHAIQFTVLFNGALLLIFLVIFEVSRTEKRVLQALE